MSILGRDRVGACLVVAGAAVWVPGAAAPTVAIFPSGAEFRLEIAADTASQRRGYMFREHVGPDEGMLFVYADIGRRPFWMKNCRVPLDIVWLDASSRVIEIAHSVPPCPPTGPCPNVEPQRMARNVLEVAAGTARRERLTAGDLVTIVPEPTLP